MKLSDTQIGWMSRRAFVGTAAASILASGGAHRLLASEHEKLPIGMNLTGINDWEPGFPFLNLMWGARVWLTRNVSGDGPFNSELEGDLDLDPDGYPLEIPFRPPAPHPPSYVFTLLPNTLSQGKYVILYDGEGEIGVGGGSRVSEAAPGRIVISMTHRGGDLLEEISIRRSVHGNHVRNIRVLPLAQEHADLDRNPFRPEFVDFCRPWHCLRFMDWLGTNDSINRHWEERKRRSFYTQVGAQGDVLGLTAPPLRSSMRRWPSGVAIELCIQIANLAKTDAWVCVPHLADDAYIRQLAEMVKERLDPQQKVYVEFSNEIWNWQFSQAQWMLRSELAGDLVASKGSPQPWKDARRPARFQDGVVVSGEGEGADHPERIAALFRRCFGIWEDVFQGADRKRLVRVCAVQTGWPETAQRTLSWVAKNGGCDALAPTGYFGPNEEIYKRWDAAGSGLSADDVIAGMHAVVAAQREVIATMRSYANDAAVRLVVYEGGQHIQPQDQTERPYNPALAAAQKHPRMYDLYRELLDEFARADCSLFCAFGSVSRQGTRWGSWGHIEEYGQDPNVMPKYRALLDANLPSL